MTTTATRGGCAIMLMIDCASLGKNKPYQDLPDLYMIYISKNDPLFGDDENVKHKIHYNIGHYIKGTGKDYDNGLYIHYFNTSAAGKGRSRLAALMRYFENSDPKNDSFGALSRRVSYFKYERGGDSMCKIVQDYAKEYGDERERKGEIKGEIKGKIKGKLETIENMLNDGFALDKALKYANLDKETYEKHCQD